MDVDTPLRLVHVECTIIPAHVYNAACVCDEMLNFDVIQCELMTRFPYVLVLIHPLRVYAARHAFSCLIIKRNLRVALP